MLTQRWCTVLVVFGLTFGCDDETASQKMPKQVVVKSRTSLPPVRTRLGRQGPKRAVRLPEKLETMMEAQAVSLVASVRVVRVSLRVRLPVEQMVALI